MNQTNKTLARLADALEDCVTPAEHVRVIRDIARTQDPDAIAILAPLLESCGEIAAATVEALLSFGQLAEGEMRRCVAESMDEDQIRNAHRVLAGLGDAYSRRAVTAHCWADLEEENAIAAATPANDQEGCSTGVRRAP
jgi:hypothetical protein